MTHIRTERTETPLLPATASGKGLATFPLGSLQSRAAARSLMSAREATRKKGILFRVSVIGANRELRGKCTCEMPEEGTFALCRCFL
jgi:hypothetical protein